MSFTVEKNENNMATLKIEVAAADFDKAIDSAYHKNKNKISVPGFRKGKVPRQMIEKMYGAGIFYEDAANEIIPVAYNEASKESGLDIVSQPEVNIVEIEKGKNFVFTATVALKPPVELGQYLGVEIDKVDTVVTDEEVEAEVEKVREQNSRLISIEDRPVQDKDQTVIDFEGFVDGVAFEGGKGEDYPLTIGSHSFIDTFEDQLIGKKIGEEVEVNVTFPAEYHAAELAGKPAMFKVTVKEIKEKELPELNDDFVQDVSEFNTVDEYKADLKANLTKKKEEAAEKDRQAKAVAKAVENSKMEIPEAMIKTQVNRMAEEFAQRLQQQGLSIDAYMQYTGSTKEAFLENLKPEAEIRIKNSLVLEAVAKAENITANDEDVEKEINDMAAMYQMEADKLKEYMGEAELKQLKDDLAIQKAADLLAEKAVEK